MASGEREKRRRATCDRPAPQSGRESTSRSTHPKLAPPAHPYVCTPPVVALTNRIAIEISAARARPSRIEVADTGPVGRYDLILVWEYASCPAGEPPCANSGSRSFSASPRL